MLLDLQKGTFSRHLTTGKQNAVAVDYFFMMEVTGKGRACIPEGLTEA